MNGDANPFDVMRSLLTSADSAQRAVQRHASQMAGMIEGHLRHVDDTDTLAKLKVELRKFNAHTKRWTK